MKEYHIGELAEVWRILISMRASAHLHFKPFSSEPKLCCLKWVHQDIVVKCLGYKIENLRIHQLVSISKSSLSSIFFRLIESRRLKRYGHYCYHTANQNPFWKAWVANVVRLSTCTMLLSLLYNTFKTDGTCWSNFCAAQTSSSRFSLRRKGKTEINRIPK